MVQDSFLFWSDATCSGEGSMLEHTAVLGEEPLETILFLHNAGSYKREISYRLLKDFEEIPLPWYNESGEDCPSDFTIEAAEERNGAVYTAAYYLDITPQMGAGRYALVLLDKPEGSIQQKRQQATNAMATRTTVIYQGENITDLPHITALKAVSYIGDIPAGGLKIGLENGFEVPAGKVAHTTLRELNQPILVALAQYLEEQGVDSAPIAGQTVPVVLIGYYDGNLLPQKYRCEIPVDRPVILYPEWELPVGGEEHILNVFAFCYPDNTIESLPTFAQKFLFNSASMLNDGICVQAGE